MLHVQIWSRILVVSPPQTVVIWLLVDYLKPIQRGCIHVHTVCITLTQSLKKIWISAIHSSRNLAWVCTHTLCGLHNTEHTISADFQSLNMVNTILLTGRISWRRGVNSKGGSGEFFGHKVCLNSWNLALSFNFHNQYSS